MKNDKGEIKKEVEKNKVLLEKAKKAREAARQYILNNGGTDEEPVPVRRNDWF